MRTTRRISVIVSAVSIGAASFMVDCAHGQQVVEEWVQTYPWPPYSYGSMITLDPDENVVSVGYVPNASDIVTTKSDPQGNLLWQRHYSMEDYALAATWVTTDASGNVVVTGYPQTFSSNPVQVGLLTIKYDRDGTFLWDDLYSGTWAFALRSIADADGNIYVTGRAWFGTYDFVTMKYAPDGTIVWLDTFDQGGGFHTPTAMDLDDAGNLVVTGAGQSGGLITTLYDASGARQWVVERTGIAGGSVAFTGDGHFYITGSLYAPPSSNDVLLQKYDLGGDLTWDRVYDFGGSELGKKLALDAQGNVFVTGVQSVYTDWLTIKTDSDGNLLWSRVHNTHTSNDEVPNFLVTGSAGEAYITGSGGPPPPGPNSSYLSMVTLRYDADGALAWTKTHYVWASRGQGVALASDNSVYVVGLGNSITTIKYAQSPVGVPASESGGSDALALLAPVPNPFRSDVEIAFSLARGGAARLSVFDMSGRRVADLVDGVRPAGVNRVVWDGRGARGVVTPPGVYVLRLTEGSSVATRKLVRTR